MVQHTGRLIMVSRPLVWLPAMCLYLLGVQWSDAPFDSLHVWIGLVFFSLPAGIIAYGLNDVADRESDALNHRKGRLYGVVLDALEVKIITRAALCFAVLFIGIFTLSGRYGAAAAILAISIVCAAYSLPPVRLKTRPGLDAVSNGLLILLIFLTGYSIETAGIPGELPPVFMVGVLLCTGAAMHIYTAALDYEADRRAGDRTVAVALGRRAALAVAAGCMAGSFWLVYDASTLVAAYVLFNLTVLTVLCVHPSPVWLRRSLPGMVAALIVCGVAVVAS